MYGEWTTEIIGAILISGLGLLGFLIRQWVESIREDLRDHMLQEEQVRLLESEQIKIFRQEIRSDIKEIRNEIKDIHSRIDQIFLKKG